MRRTFAGLLLSLAPAVAPAFEVVDTVPYPSLGGFPAYPAEAGGPGRLFAQIGVMRDDNILRRSGGEQAETITRLGLGTGYDARVYGRQVVHLEARADAYVFNRFNELDHVAYGVLGEWRWELGNQLSGTLGYGRRRFQTDLTERQAAVTDRVTENRVYGTAGYRFMPDWRVRGGFAAAQADRPAGVADETSSHLLTAGIDYVTPLGNTLGLEVRRSEGDAPVSEAIDPTGLFANNDFEEQEIAAVATYNPGAQLRLGARLGHTERTYSVLPGFDFKGTTYRLDAGWRPGNKTLLGFELYKTPRPLLDVDATHVVTRGVAFGPNWAPTAKLVFAARLVRERREYPGNPAALGLIAIREEIVRGLRLSAGWEATRRHHLGLGFETGERRSNVLDRDYDYNAVMANFRYVF